MSDRVCDNCRHYRGQSPGVAGICFFKWRDLRWNEGPPLMPRDGTCDDFSPQPQAVVGETRPNHEAPHE